MLVALAAARAPKRWQTPGPRSHDVFFESIRPFRHGTPAPRRPVLVRLRLAKWDRSQSGAQVGGFATVVREPYLPSSDGSPIEARDASWWCCPLCCPYLPSSDGSPIEAMVRSGAVAMSHSICRLRTAAPLKRAVHGDSRAGDDAYLPSSDGSPIEAATSAYATSAAVAGYLPSSDGSPIEAKGSAPTRRKRRSICRLRTAAPLKQRLAAMKTGELTLSAVFGRQPH